MSNLLVIASLLHFQYYIFHLQKFHVGFLYLPFYHFLNHSHGFFYLLDQMEYLYNSCFNVLVYLLYCLCHFYLFLLIVFSLGMVPASLHSWSSFLDIKHCEICIFQCWIICISLIVWAFILVPC